MQKLDFQAAAAKLEGSRDTGAQLFCTLLRSVGVDTRLVCSLQPLPFTATVRVTEPPRLTSASVLADPASKTASSADDSGVDVEVGVSPGTSEAIESSGGRHSRFTSSLPSRLGLSSQSNNIDLSTLNSRRIVKSMQALPAFYRSKTKHRRISSKTHQRIPFSSVLGGSLRRGSSKVDPHRSSSHKHHFKTFQT